MDWTADFREVLSRALEPPESMALLSVLLAGYKQCFIVGTDDAGRIVVWSAGAMRMFGHHAENALGRSIGDVLHLGADFDELYAAAIRAGILERTLNGVTVSGMPFASRSTILLRRNTAAEPIGLLVLSYEGEAQPQQRYVTEAARTKQDFLATMSHELRTPLNAIIGFSELLFDGKTGDLQMDQRQFVGHILSSARQLLQFIHDVLDLTRADVGQLLFAADRVDVDRLARHVREVLRPDASMKRLIVTIDVDPRLGQIVGDEARLQQVLYHYLSNAIRFTPEGGRVRVRVHPEGDDMFRLSVEDTGIGVRPEHIGRLFVEFEPLDPSTTKVHQGKGLGLALTRRIVEAQGGSVEVRSTPGQGSTFSAVLPRHSTKGVGHAA